ncbi:hypothetical protein [Halochromatium sp.]
MKKSAGYVGHTGLSVHVADPKKLSSVGPYSIIILTVTTARLCPVRNSSIRRRDASWAAERGDDDIGVYGKKHALEQSFD